MDQRDEYWGNPIIHDPGEYNSPQHYDTMHHQTQQQQQQHIPSNPNFPPYMPSPDHSVILPQHQLQHHTHHQRYDQQHLSRNITISATDVLCGRGKTSFNHEGNKSFRNAVSAALEDFVNAVNRFEKAIVVQRVVDMVVSRGGRFLKEDVRAGTWYQLSEQQSKEKVGHAIRDAANLYEVRKKKEEQMQQLSHQENNTPQLKRTGSDDDNTGKGSTWWSSYNNDESSDFGNSTSKKDHSKEYRSTYTPNVDYSVTSAAKRRGSLAPSQTTDYQPQQKRRRTYSPPQKHHSYFESTMALSEHVVSTPSPPKHHHIHQQQERDDVFIPTSLRSSPIAHPTSSSNIVSSGGSQKSSSAGAGGIMTNVSSRLKQSPIETSNKAPKQEPKQYYHRFTVYDPHEPPPSSPSRIHHQFHPETKDDEYSPPDDPILSRHPPPASHAEWSGYGRSDFVQSLTSYDDQRHYPPPLHHHYRPPVYPSTAGIAFPAMGRHHHQHRYPYPQQPPHHYSQHQQQHHSLPILPPPQYDSSNIRPYGPPPSVTSYYPRHEEHQRGSTYMRDWTRTATVTDSADDNTVQHERQHGDDYSHVHNIDNNTNDDDVDEGKR